MLEYKSDVFTGSKPVSPTGNDIFKTFAPAAAAGIAAPPGALAIGVDGAVVDDDAVVDAGAFAAGAVVVASGAFGVQAVRIKVAGKAKLSRARFRRIAFFGCEFR